MKTVVISLPQRKDRRANIKKIFAKYNYTNYSFFDAVTGSGSTNGLSLGEEGLWRSTIQVLEKVQYDKECIHIAEDDCQLSGTFFWASGELEQILNNSDIDILFTDSWAGGNILLRILELSPDKGIRILPGTFYGGRTTSYLIRKTSIGSLLEMLKTTFEQMRRGSIKAEPIDGYFRKQQAASGLRLALTAPFLTTTSQEKEIARSDISTDVGTEQRRWEDINTLTSQLPFIEYDKQQGIRLLCEILQELEKEQTAVVAKSLVEFLVSTGYIRKARQKDCSTIPQPVRILEQRH